MINLRCLTEKGKDRFSECISELKGGLLDSIPADELNEEPFSFEYNPRVLISDVSFSTRLEIGKYLSKTLENIDGEDLRDNSGVWSWLALYWFDMICPFNSEGKRKVNEEARYLCSNNYTDYYRHLIASSYYIYNVHGEEFSRIFLECGPSEHRDITEQIASKQNIISSVNIIKAIDTLYWDRKRNEPKRGVASYRNKLGNIRRFKTMLDQFELTYDLHSMGPEELISILPKEFDGWKR